MLNSLVRNTGLDAVLDATISIDTKRIFKPSPEAYSLIEGRLGVAPTEVMLVNLIASAGLSPVGLITAAQDENHILDRPVCIPHQSSRVLRGKLTKSAGFYAEIEPDNQF